MRLLLGSGGLSTDERRNAWVTEFDDFLGAVRRVLFVAWAVGDEAGHTAMVAKLSAQLGIELDGMHAKADPRRAVEEADALFVTGGNTFRLLKRIHDAGVLDVVRAKVRAGMPYVGISAGTNVACPTISTTNDMPVCWPPTREAFGLVPFQVNPHFTPGRSYHVVDGAIEPYAGETRLDRLREYHEMNDLPVLALREGAILRVEHGSARLAGPGGGLVLRRGEDAVPLSPGADVSHLLGAAR
jgi:dipeptidase E